MDALLTFAYIMVGIALGAGADWLYWRQKFRLAGEQANASGENLRQEYDEKVRALESRLAEKEGLLTAGGEKNAALEGDLAAVRGQHREMEAQLAAETRKLAAAEAVNARIPELEASLAEKEAAIARLAEEKAALEGRVAALQQEIAEEKRSLQECLIFVEGSHYLPGKVVRNLTGDKISEAHGERGR